VKFSGPAVTLDARNSLSVGSGGVIFADGAVTLNAPYVSLGGAFVAPSSTAITVGGASQFMPTYGLGSLTVNASLIDIGVLSLAGHWHGHLVADGGIFVGRHVWMSAGNINMTAARFILPRRSVSRLPHMITR